jgi:hypothetical protein
MEQLTRYQLIIKNPKNKYAMNINADILQHFFVIRADLIMEAARTSETLVNFYQTTRCYNPEDSHLHTHRPENLKSYILTQH